jgi:preprotein translocase subunit SecB
VQAQLNLNDYYIDEFSFVVNREHVPSESLCGTIDLDFDISRNSDNQLDFMICLMVDINPREEDFLKCDYRIHLKLTGFFSFADGTTEDTIKNMIAPNGLSMLYGVARGVVANVTSTSWHGKFVLPSMNLTEVIKRKAETASKPEKSARKTKKK